MGILRAVVFGSVAIFPALVFGFVLSFRWKSRIYKLGNMDVWSMLWYTFCDDCNRIHYRFEG